MTSATSHTHIDHAPGAFADRLAEAIDRANSPACIGLDPVLEKLPPALLTQQQSATDAVKAFCLGVLHACKGIIPAVKPQAACFERFGSVGVRVLHEVIAAARAEGYIVILDAKRGDIGLTAEHYAAAAFDGPHPADALTVSGYLGPDTLEPYLMHAGHGVFVLVRTSNPGSDSVQSLRLADGRTVAEMMADHVAALGLARRGQRGLSDVGAVVAATKPADAAALRARMPDQFFLIPGYGAQGGSAADIQALVRPSASARPGSAGVVVTASRSVIYAFQGATSDWMKQVKAAAEGFSVEVRAVLD